MRRGEAAFPEASRSRLPKPHGFNDPRGGLAMKALLVAAKNKKASKLDDPT